MNIIITDCFDNKHSALEGPFSAALFGRDKFITQQLVYHGPKEETPRSLQDLAQEAAERISMLTTNPSLQRIKETYPPSLHTFYYATVRKGFFCLNESWHLAALAYVGKSQGQFFTGLAHAPALLAEAWNYMHLPKEERYEKFSDLYPLFRVKPLISCIDETTEVDWYKEAFRGCVPQVVAQK